MRPSRTPLLLLVTLACAGACSADEDTVVNPDVEEVDDTPDLEDLEWLDGGDWIDDALDDATAPVDAAPGLDAPAPRDVPTARDAGMDALADASRDAVAFVDAPAPRDVPAPPVDAGFAFPTPIHHVVVLVRENRTFDNLFTGFPGAETTTFGVRSTGAHVPLRLAPDGDLPGDIRHSHPGAIMAFAGGAMNGFDRNAQLHSDTGNPLGPFVHYAEAQIPNYWQYARRYVLADHFFSTALTCSSPGHFAFWTAQTPIIDNPDCTGTLCGNGSGCLAPRSTVTTLYQATCAVRSSTAAPCLDVPTVVDAFPSALTWRVYAEPNANANGIVSSPLAMARGITRNRAAYMAHMGAQSTLIPDLEAGRQANLVVAHVGGAAGEHPPAGLCAGENFAVRVVNAVMRGPHWNDTAILLTYDDWGGFYDHVRPPQERCSNGDHVHLGFRLPLIVVSPYARRSNDPAHPYVFHGVTEQSSVPRLVEDLFRLPRMSARDANARDGRAGSLLGVFDFAHPDATPMILPTRTCP